MKFSMCTLVLSAVVAFAGPETWQPTQFEVQYAEVMSLAHAAESYSGFFAAEDAAFEALSPEYYQARWDFLRTLHYETPEASSSWAALKPFIAICKKQGLNPDHQQTFSNAAFILGMEMITDAPPFNVEPCGGKEIKGIPYTSPDGYSQKLDLYLPKEPFEKPVPCILFIHGGGWNVHKRAWMESHARVLAREGYAAATADYRLVPGVTPIECAADAKAAVRWVRKNAEKYGIDPNKIGACGGSAGAQLSVLLATSGDDKKWNSNDDVSDRIQAAVGYATPAMTGRTTWPISNGAKKDWYDTVSPYNHVSEGDVPLLLLHGTADHTVSVDESKDLHAKYQELGLTSELEPIEGAGHVFYMNETTALKTFHFFQRIF